MAGAWKALGWVGGTLAALGLASFAVAQALAKDPAVTTWATREVLARLQQGLPARLSVEAVRLQPWGLEVELEGVALAHPKAPRRPLVRLRQASLGLALGPLWRQQYQIERLHLKGLEVEATHLGQGRLDLLELLPPGPPQAKPGPSPWLEVRSLRLEEGRLRWHDPPRGLEAAWEGLRLETDFALRPMDAKGHVGWRQGTLRQGGKTLALGPLASAFTLERGDRLSWQGLRLEAQGTRLEGQGRLGGLKGKAPTLRASLRLGGDLAPWSAWARRPVAGHLQAELEAEGPVADPRLRWALEGRELAAEGLRVRRLSQGGSWGPEALELRRLEAELLGGRLQASGTLPRPWLVAPEGPASGATPMVATAPGRLEAEVGGLELAQALRVAGLAPPAGMSGRLQAKLALEFPREAPQRLSGRASLGWQGRLGVPKRGLQPASLHLALGLREGLGRLEQGQLRLGGLGLKAQGRLGPWGPQVPYDLRLTLPEGPLGPLLALAPTPYALQGKAAAELQVQGRGARWKAHLKARSGATVAPSLAASVRPLPVRLEAEAEVGPSLQVQVRRLAVQALGGWTRLAGLVEVGGARTTWDLGVEAQGLQLAALNQTYGLLDGPLEGLVAASGRLRGMDLALHRSEVRAWRGRALAKGQVHLSPLSYRVGVEAQGLALAGLQRSLGSPSGARLEGALGARLQVAGRKGHLEARGGLQAQGGAWVPNELGGPPQRLPLRLDAQLEATKRRAHLHPLHLSLGAARLQASGPVALDGPSDLRFEAQVQDLAPLSALAGSKLRGGPLACSGQLQGPAEGARLRLDGRLGAAQVGSTRLGQATWRVAGLAWPRAQLTGGVEADRLVVGGQPIAALRLPFRYQASPGALGKGQLQLPRVEVKLVEGMLQGEAAVALGARRYQARLQGVGLSLVDLAPEEEVEELPLRTPLRLAFAGQGSFASPGGRLQVGLAPLVYRGAQLGSSELVAELAAGDRLSLRAKLLGDRLLAQGSFPLGQAPGQLRLAFDRLQLGPLAAMAPAALRERLELPVEGVVDGQVLVQGPLRRPSAMAAQLELKQLQLQYRDLALGNQGPLRLSYRDRAVQLDAFHLVGTGTDLEARGRAALAGPVSLDLDGVLNLALLEKLAPRSLADSAGSLKLKASLRGTPGKPDLQGELRLSDGAFAARAMPQALRDMSLTLRLASDRILLEEFSSTVGHSGKVEASGGARLGPDGQPQAVELNARAREVVVRVPDASVTLNADLAFAGSPKSSRLDGQVTVLEGRYTKDIPLVGRSATRTSAVPAPEDPLEGYPFLEGLKLRLAVLIPDQVTVNNNLAKLQLRGDVVVAGTSARPLVVGRVEAPEGEVYFQDRTYQLEEATVDFVDPQRIVPFMNLQAKASIKGYDLRLTANGTPEALKLNLSSTPFLPEADLLVLMATGQTPSELSRNAGDVNAAAGAAGNFLLGQLTQGVSRGIAEGGVVDLLQIQPGSIDPTQPGVGSLTVGKRLSEQLMITYTQDLTSEPGRSSNKLIFDYLLTDSIVLKLENQLGGGFNASARYRIPLR